MHRLPHHDATGGRGCAPSWRSSLLRSKPIDQPRRQRRELCFLAGEQDPLTLLDRNTIRQQAEAAITTILAVPISPLVVELVGIERGHLSWQRGAVASEFKTSLLGLDHIPKLR